MIALLLMLNAIPVVVTMDNGDFPSRGRQGFRSLGSHLGNSDTQQRNPKPAKRHQTHQKGRQSFYTNYIGNSGGPGYARKSLLLMALIDHSPINFSCEEKSFNSKLCLVVLFMVQQFFLKNSTLRLCLEILF